MKDSHLLLLRSLSVKLFFLLVINAFSFTSQLAAGESDPVVYLPSAASPSYSTSTSGLFIKNGELIPSRRSL